MLSEANIDIVRNFMTALDNNEQDLWGDFLADDFTFSGWTPRSLTKSDFLSVMAGLKEGLPGLIFNLHNVQEDGNKVLGTWQVVGYQTDSFNLPALGLPPIPQMARSVSLPTEDVTYIVENGHIVLIFVQPNSEGGIKGLLRQLGINVPIIQ
jgi:hypothetical protein